MKSHPKRKAFVIRWCVIGQESKMRAELDALIEGEVKAAAAEIVEALSKSSPWKSRLEPFRSSETIYCIHCGCSYQSWDDKAEHKTDCVWSKARAAQTAKEAES